MQHPALNFYKYQLEENGNVVQGARDEWKYYVIRFTGSNAGVNDLNLACSITPVTLILDLTITHHVKGNGSIYNQWALLNHFDKLSRTELDKIDNDDFSEIGNINSMIKKTESEFPEIIRSIKMFHSLRQLNSYSDFFVFGMFTVIESIISHAPKSSETGDSISHQMRTKIPLLFKRMKNSPDYADYFGESKESNVWKQLYDYRSSIAHGGRIDFAGKRRILKDKDTVGRFLNNTTKAILRQALIEPQLITDLREC